MEEGGGRGDGRKVGWVGNGAKDGGRGLMGSGARDASGGEGGGDGGEIGRAGEGGKPVEL